MLYIFMLTFYGLIPASILQAKEFTMNGVFLFETTIFVILIIIIINWLSIKIKTPSSVMLIVGGSFLAFIPNLPDIAFEPELILLILLPPLLMDGAYFTAVASFRQHISGILLLAVGAVLFTTLCIGVVVHFLIPTLPWAACFVLGAIVSPPDAVSARAILNKVKLPSRITTLLEGESLLNDASGLVLFKVAATLGGVFSFKDAAMDFILLSFGGVIVGVAISIIWIAMLRFLKNDNLMALLSVILCWVTYIVAEKINVSGVIATVSAGLIYGWFQHREFSATVRLKTTFFWKIMVFLLEAIVFILIGLSLKGVIERVGGVEKIATTMGMTVVSITVAVIFSRFIWVFLVRMLTLALHKYRLSFHPLSVQGAAVLSWAGMRGIVTMAVAFTLPEEFPGRDLMLITAFSVILVTVMLQGASLGWMIRWLRPQDKSKNNHHDIRAVRKIISYEKKKALDSLKAREIKKQGFSSLVNYFSLQIANDETHAYSDLKGNCAQEEVVIDKLIGAARAALLSLHESDKISDTDMHYIEREIDFEELYLKSAISNDE